MPHRVKAELTLSLYSPSRINIGNARIQGLERDLNMAGHDYNIALFVFFVPYTLLEIPSNLLMKRLRPSYWLSATMLAWGIVTICQGLSRSFAGLVVCRILLGVFEAGFVPGAVYLFSMYYKRHELQQRVNIFFCFPIVSGAFSGLLAYALSHMAGICHYSGWRWIFIIEGVATVVLAAVAPLFIPDWPQATSFLTSDQRNLVVWRVAHDVQDAKMDRWDKAAARRIFGDVKIYLFALMYLGTTNNGYAVSFFTPTILKELGWTSVRAQVMSIPIYVVSAVLVVAVGIAADRLRHRVSFILAGCLIATIGYAILLSDTNKTDSHPPSVGARYLALYLVAGGGYIALPMIIVWLSNNVAGHYKRAASLALQIGFGNCSGVIASNIFVTSQAPRYPLGFGLSLALMWVTVVCALAVLFVLVRENRRRDAAAAAVAGPLGSRQARQGDDSDALNLGDDDPAFRFTY